MRFRSGNRTSTLYRTAVSRHPCNKMHRLFVTTKRHVHAFLPQRQRLSTLHHHIHTQLLLIVHRPYKLHVSLLVSARSHPPLLSITPTARVLHVGVPLPLLTPHKPRSLLVVLQTSRSLQNGLSLPTFPWPNPLTTLKVVLAPLLTLHKHTPVLHTVLLPYPHTTCKLLSTQPHHALTHLKCTHTNSLTPSPLLTSTPLLCLPRLHPCLRRSLRA